MEEVYLIPCFVSQVRVRHRLWQGNVNLHRTQSVNRSCLCTRSNGDIKDLLEHDRCTGRVFHKLMKSDLVCPPPLVVFVYNPTTRYTTTNVPGHDRLAGHVHVPTDKLSHRRELPAHDRSPGRVHGAIYRISHSMCIITRPVARSCTFTWTQPL